MALAIESPRFGHVEIDPETVIEFPDGLIGLGGSRYALLTSDPGNPIGAASLFNGAREHRRLRDQAGALVEVIGIEPTTSCLQSRRSPN